MMTNEQILQKALEKYPPEYEQEDFDETWDMNEQYRKPYIEALLEVESLPKIKGWVTRDKPGYGNSRGWLRLHFREPEKTVRDWDSKDEFDVDDSQILKDNMFPDLTWESEPLKVELIIRKS